MPRDTHGLEADVDVRLVELWALVYERGTRLAEVMDEDPELADAIGSTIRAAYGRGYCDALKEEREGRRAELATAHGYRAL